MAVDYRTPIYPIRQAAAAAGFELNTLRSLYRRGHFRIIGGEEAKSRGLGHALNLRDIMHVAVAKRLMDVGVHPKDAFDAGTHFAHTASGATRDPAEMFDEGFTVLVYFVSTGSTRVVPMKDVLEFSTLFINRETGERENPLLILLNDVERDVFIALGVGSRPAGGST